MAKLLSPCTYKAHQRIAKRKRSSRSFLFESLEKRRLLAGDPVQVFLLVGQSNMGGSPDQIDIAEPFSAPQSDVLIWQDDLDHNVGWTALRPGFGGDSNYNAGGDGTQFGPEIAFGRSLADELPSSSFALIKHGHAGPGATMEDGWNPSRDDGAGPGQIWTDFTNKVNDALDAFEASQTSYEIVGLVVAQGARDMVSETGVEAEEYEQNFTNFIVGVRQTFSAPDLPVIFAKSGPFRLGTEHREGAILVRSAQEAVAAADPLTFMVTADDLPTLDGAHLDAEGQIEFGDRFADAYRGQSTYGSTVIANDGFETRNFSGGAGQWGETDWSAKGDSSVTVDSAPHAGSHHALLRRGSGDLVRSVDVSGFTDVKLRFWSRAESFEGSDRAEVSVSSDGVNWQVIRTLVNGDDDGHYRFYQEDLPDLGDTIYVRFDAEMNNRRDRWYLDDVAIVGTPAGPPEILIGDATITEGNDALQALDTFVVEGSGGLSTPRRLTFGPDGNLYVGSVDTGEILRYDGQTGAFLDAFVSGGGVLQESGDLQFSPIDGHLYVSDVATNQIHRFDGQTGTYLDSPVSGLARPLGVTFTSDGSLLIANRDADEVLLYDGSTLSTFVGAGSGGLDVPRNAVFGPDGMLYVSSENTREILRYDGTSGAFVDVFATIDLGNHSPNWIEFGGDGILYASSRTADTCCNRSLVRIDGATGDVIDTFDKGVDGWSFTIGPDNLIYNAGNSFGNVVTRMGPESTATFTVSLSVPSPTTVTVDYTTSDGSATAGSDYGGTSGILVFEPGVASRTVVVASMDDDITEDAEDFTVILSNATGATIVDPEGVGTILNDGDGVNQPPTADAGSDQTVIDGDGSGDELVTLDGSGSVDTDGSIVAYEWTDGTQVIGSSEVITTTLPLGTHTLTLNVTDDGGATDSDIVVVTVGEVLETMHVGDLDGAVTSLGKNWRADVSITVLDSLGEPVPNATVEFTWSGGFSGSGSGVTNANGQVTVSSGSIRKNRASTTLTVTSITHAIRSYAPEENTDPDGDSNGTAITVFKDGTTAAGQVVWGNERSITPVTLISSPTASEVALPVEGNHGRSVELITRQSETPPRSRPAPATAHVTISVQALDELFADGLDEQELLAQISESLM